MAYLHTGILGPVSGKVGNLVFYIVGGKNFVRRAPCKSKKKPTLKQKIQRAKFGEVVAFISPIAKLINASYKSVKHRSLGTNVLVRQILKEGIVGRYPHFEVYCPEVSLLKGKLPRAGGALHYDGENDKFNLTWPVLADPDHLEDRLIVLLQYCTQGDWSVAENVAQRAQGSCSLRIDKTFGNDMVRVWIAFRSADQRNFSDSQYMGEIRYQELSDED